MTNGRNGLILRHLRQLAAGRVANGVADSDLLARFVDRHDEAAFEALVRRHGPMVLRVARRVLSNLHDAEDVFQATFLTLVRRAASIRKQESVAAWLYGVAYRVAMKARTDAAKRQARQKPKAVSPTPDPLAELSARELCESLDTELNRLPEKCRAAWILCHLEGRTRDEAAQQLGVSLATLKRCLEQGRELLRARLSRRGIALSAALSAAALSESSASAALLPTLIVPTIKTAALVAAGKATAGLVSPKVAAMTEGVLKAMFVNKLKIASAVVLALAFAVGGGRTLVLPMFAVGEERAGQENKDSSDAAKRANPGPDRDKAKKTPATAFDDCVVKDVVITTAVEVPHFIRVTLRGTQVQVGLSVAKDASVVINGKDSLPLQLQEGMQASLKLGSDGRTVTAIEARSHDDTKVNSDKEDATVDKGKKTAATAFDGCVVKDVATTTAVEVPHFIRVTLRGTQVEVGLSVAKDASVVINGKDSLPLQLQEGMQASLKLGSDGRTVTAIEAHSRDDTKANSDKEDAKVEKEYIRVEVKGILHYKPPPLLEGGIQPITGTVVLRGVTIVAKGITWRIAIDMDRKDKKLDSLPLDALKGKTVIAIGTLDGSMSHTELEVEGIRPTLVLKSLKAVESK